MSHLEHDVLIIGIYYPYRDLRNIPRVDISKGLLSIALSQAHSVLTAQVGLLSGVFLKPVGKGVMFVNMTRYSMPTP